jgi:hypothetical protein
MRIVPRDTGYDGRVSLGLKRCWDLTDAHIKAALGSRRAMGQLLREMAAVARPSSGAPKILIALARLAGPTCDWMEGSLRVELTSVEGETHIRTTEDLGGGVMEVVFPRLVVPVPFEEFERSLRLAPRAVEPLKVRGAEKGSTSIVLSHRRSRSTKMPAAFELAEDCLRRSMPPAVRRSLAPPPASEALPPRRMPGEPVLRRRARSGRPGNAPAQPRDGFILEIPRAPKLLDFGDLVTKDRDTAPAPKKPSRVPPRK